MSESRSKQPSESERQAVVRETVPKAVVSRLSLYLRELQSLVQEDKETTNSNQLGSLLGLTGSQVRKDLAYFGHFGQPGVGYRCEELIRVICGILGTDQRWKVAMIGTGNLGRALLGYKGFLRQGFHIVAAFDVDPAKVGTSVERVPVHPIDALTDIVRGERIQLGIIAVPASEAQSVADGLVAAGIRGIVNFAPVTIQLPKSVSLLGVDLAIELEQVSFSVVSRFDSR